MPAIVLVYHIRREPNVDTENMNENIMKILSHANDIICKGVSEQRGKRGSDEINRIKSRVQITEFQKMCVHIIFTVQIASRVVGGENNR